jgi:hypothetical protein
MRAETAAQAPWRAAIVAARGLKLAMCEAQAQTRDARNDPIRGAPGRQTPGSSNDPIRGSGGQARDKRNDPIRGTAARVRAAGRPLDTQVGVLAERRAGETARWSAGSPGLGEALAWEVGKRRLRAEVGPRGNDPIRGKAVGAGVEDGARVARAVTGFGMMRGLALGGTTLARTWEPSAAKVLAGQFGPAVVVGWPGVPSGIAAMPSGGCAQRPYTRSGRPGADGGGDRVGR